ncbi:MAG: hypothetical protein AAGF11_15750 [Myxococcota bacterium]
MVRPSRIEQDGHQEGGHHQSSSSSPSSEELLPASPVVDGQRVDALLADALPIVLLPVSAPMDDPSPSPRVALDDPPWPGDPPVEPPVDPPVDLPVDPPVEPSSSLVS